MIFYQGGSVFDGASFWVLRWHWKCHDLVLVYPVLEATLGAFEVDAFYLRYSSRRSMSAVSVACLN